MATLNYFLALSCIAILCSGKEKLLFVLLSTIAAATGLYFLLGNIIKQLIEKNEFYYGGEEGFITDTVQSLLRQSFYLQSDNNTLLVISYLLVVCVLVLFVSQIYIAIKRRKVDLNFAMILLLVLPALGTITQHYLFDSKFLLERTSLFFYPLFIIGVSVVLVNVREKLGTIVLGVVTMILTLAFVVNYNIYSTKDWYLDKYVPMALHRIIESKPSKPVKLYMDWRLTAATHYTIQAKYKDEFDKLEWYNTRFYELNEYDYCLITDPKREKVPDMYIVDTSFIDNRVLLYKSR